MSNDVMQYQLVLQWPVSRTKDLDFLIKIEDVLLGMLSKLHEVDGHDIGSGELNIFVLTNDPLTAFDEVKAALPESDVWSDLRVAYRAIDKNGYTILWPTHLSKFEVQ
jgi:hypothetical protein